MHREFQEEVTSAGSAGPRAGGAGGHGDPRPRQRRRPRRVRGAGGESVGLAHWGLADLAILVNLFFGERQGEQDPDE